MCLPVKIASTCDRRFKASVEDYATEAAFGLHDETAAQGVSVCSDVLIVVLADDRGIISLIMASFKHQQLRVGLRNSRKCNSHGDLG